jgi:hypothetical protein
VGDEAVSDLRKADLRLGELALGWTQGAELTVSDPQPSRWGRVAVLAPALIVAACAVAATAASARRFATNQYWRRHNIIWQKGWDDAMEIRDAHLNAYEADPERYVAEHGLSLVRGGAAR